MNYSFELPTKTQPKKEFDWRAAQANTHTGQTLVGTTTIRRQK
jgi:hypothetical protein